jgi:carboxyl-terminal processing protease
MRNILPTLLALCAAFASYAQKTTDYRNEALLLIKNLNAKHFSPRTLDDKFSEEVFNQCLSNLDPHRVLFTDKEILLLTKYKSSLDDELSGKSWNFLTELTKMYIANLQRAETHISSITETAFAENINEYYENDTTRWPINEIELKAKWRTLLKYRAFEKLATIRNNAKNNINGFYSKHEPFVRQHVKSSALRSIKKIQQHPWGTAASTASIYFKSITSVYDPHTVYLSTTEMENFIAALSIEGYYFGITLTENPNGDVAIKSVTPGSPAWKSGEVHESDIVLNLTWEGQKQQDIGISLDEANDLLEDANHTTMEFTLQSANGVVKKIKLKKEKISLEENYAHSYILNGGYKIGYISLPDFYTTWGHETSGSKCATDVAEEIVKLKKENIKGLILDLRHNGGGALKEAIAMAGIFIDEGPLGIMRERDQVGSTLKDANRGTIYDGPLIILVNSRSASASEFLAAALQDYNRAIIVGSTTYGKATAQNIYALLPGQTEPSLAATKSGIGFASITTNKVYRVSGASVQGKGVRPDIVLPDVFAPLTGHEDDLPFALPADSAKKRTYYKPLLPMPLVKLRKQSELRVQSSESLQSIYKASTWIDNENKLATKPVLLNWNQFIKRKEESSLHTIAIVKPSQTFYEVVNSAVDQKRMNVDEYADAFSKSWKEKLSHDIYVMEAFLILSDLLEINCQ